MNRFSFLLHPSKKMIALLVVIVLVIGFLFIRSKRQHGPALTYSPAKRQTIAQSVSASGVLAGVNTANIKFQTAGKLASVPVAVGTSVSVGTTIASLDTKELQTNLTEAQNSLRQAEATVADIYDQVQGHATDETYAMRDTRTKAEVARDNAYEAVVAAQQAFDQAVVTSPLSGVVTQVNSFPGQNVSPADVVAQVVDTSQIYFDADVDESDVANVYVGQPATVTLNAYPDQTFKGTVTEIEPTTHTTTSGATVVTARINLGNPSITFAEGLNGQADMVQQQVSNALTIPLEALQDDNTVFVKRGKTVQLVPVTPGIRSDTDVEIKSGLQEGDMVVTNPQVVPKNTKTMTVSQLLLRPVVAYAYASH